MPLTPEQNLSNIREVFGWDSDAATICKLDNEREKLKAELAAAEAVIMEFRASLDKSIEHYEIGMRRDREVREDYVITGQLRVYRRLRERLDEIVQKHTGQEEAP